MENYLITASVDGVDVDFETKLRSIDKPNYYYVADLCMEHDCPFFYVNKLDEQGQVIDYVEW